MITLKIKTGDMVRMLNGKDRAKTGKVVSVFPRSQRVVVEGLNMMKKHVRARRQGQKGQIISKERTVHASSVALMCRACGKMTRVGFRIEGKEKIRICKKCKAVT